MKAARRFNGLTAAAFAVIAAVGLITVAAAQQAAQNFTGNGGKGMSLTILAPTASGLAKNQSYLPALVQGEFVSNFSGYSAISVLDRERADALIAEVVGSESYSDAEREKMASQIGNRVPTTHFMGGNITKTATGYALQISITKTDDKTTTASYSGTFTFAELDNLTGIRRASLDLLQKAGVALTETARAELAGAAAESRVNAQTALAKGVTAQRERSEVAALSYYFQAAAFDPSLMEAANRSSKLNANITSGSMGENIRNDIQWRKDWVARLTEAEQFFDNFNKTESMPYTLYYSDDIKQGKVNYQTETVDLSIGTYIIANYKWARPMERALQAVYDGLDATKRKGEWQLGDWPRQGVTNLNAFAERRQNFSVVFELLNNQNKVIGRQTLQAGGYWGFGGGRPNVSTSTFGRNTVDFQNVNANDITDRMTIRVASVNGEAAEAAARKGILQITSPKSFDWRDGKNYRTLKIGKLIWMTENLNYQTGSSKCYGNDTSNCKKYGSLYDWIDAQSACPAGWRLPTDDDWGYLVGLADVIAGKNFAAELLKSTSGWNNNGNGTDEFGFSALPGGRRGNLDGSFNGVGYYGYWWSATAIGASDAWVWLMSNITEYVFKNDADKSSLLSVRCVQEEDIEKEARTQKEKAQKEAEEKERINKLKSYKYTGRTVKIGKQTWMAENLNNESAGGKCYGNDPSNCEKYGRLYTWAEAVKACPAGWHLPTDAEWTTLVDYAGGEEKAGKQLRAKDDWADGKGSVKGTDEYGFSALPSGIGTSVGYFLAANNNGFWWSATEADASTAWNLYMDNDEGVYKEKNKMVSLLSVRCVAD